MLCFVDDPPQSSGETVRQNPDEEHKPFPASVASDNAVDWEFPLNAYGFRRPLTMPLNMVDPQPIPSSAKLLLPAAPCTTGGISLPAPLSALRQLELESQEMMSCRDDYQPSNAQVKTKLDKMMSMVQTCCEPKPNGDKPTVEDVKELMKTAEMRIPVDSKLLAKMMANCPNEEIMAKLTTMQVDQLHAMKFTAEVKELMKTPEMRPPSSTTLMALAATDGIGCYHGHNKFVGTLTTATLMRQTGASSGCLTTSVSRAFNS